MQSDPCPEIRRLNIAFFHLVIIYESGFDAEADCWYELMEYAAYGSLAQSFSSGRAKDFAFEDIVRELREAIAALQDADMAHRDVKPANILLRSEKPLDLILTDFGITSVMHGVSLRETARNFTPEYAPPETEVASKAGFGRLDKVIAPCFCL